MDLYGVQYIRFFATTDENNDIVISGHLDYTIRICKMLGSKGQNPVRACTIRCLTLGPAKHEEVAIYVVNQRILNVLELRE